MDDDLNDIRQRRLAEMQANQGVNFYNLYWQSLLPNACFGAQNCIYL